MSGMAGKITDAKLKGLKPPASGQIEIADSDVTGLRARIGASGAISFILRRRIGDKVRNITIGHYGPRFGIGEARRKARALVSDLEAGKPVQPARARSATKAETIRGLVPQYIAAKSHLRSVPEIERILNGYVLPELGDRLAETVTRGDVTRLIDGIADRAPTMARAVHAQLSAFYSWAMPRLDRLPANPCRDAGRPAKAKARDRVLSDDELAALWRIAELEAAPWGPAIKLLILTGTRREEVFSADRAEFDLAAREWTIPADRAKNGLPLIVPLSDAARAVVASIGEVDGSGKLFPTRTKARQADAGPSGFSKAMARIRAALDLELERDGGEHWQLHDIRRTVATGLQRLGVRFEVTEAVLNHVSGSRGGIAGVYQRHDWKAEKRAALDAWAELVERIVKGLVDV
jgi:integrase